MGIGRIILAALLGGVVVFVWSFVSHTVLPFGEMGIRVLPDEPAVVGAMKRSVTERGAYFIPGMDMDNPTEAETKRWEEAYRAGPRGLLIYDPSGDNPMSPTMLAVEFLSGLAAAIIAAAISFGLRAGYIGRVVAVTALGVFGWLAIDVSYWNWYRFPDAFALAELIDQAAGWFLAGLVIAAIARPARWKVKIDTEDSSYPTMISRAQ